MSKGHRRTKSFVAQKHPNATFKAAHFGLKIQAAGEFIFFNDEYLRSSSDQRLTCIWHVKVVRGLAPYRSPRVKDQVPCVLLHRMIMTYFGKLGFKSFRFSPLAFICSVFSRSPLIVVVCPSKSNSGSLLRDFRLWEFQDFPSQFPLECLPPNLQIRCHTSSKMNGQYLLWEFRLQEFQLPHSCFPPK
jgi:hypothetical protein